MIHYDTLIEYLHNRMEMAGLLFMDNETDLFSDDILERHLSDLIKPGQSVSELLINTTYLFDTWVCAALPHITDDADFLHDLNLTKDERFYFFLGYTGTLLDKDYGGRVFFNIVRQAYRLRGLMNRLPEPELMKEVWRLAEKLNAIKDEDAPKIDDMYEQTPDEPDLEDVPGLKYPPENDAEALEYVREHLYGALGYCGQLIGKLSEEWEKEEEEDR